MKHLPLFFDLSGRKVVVVGEGPTAERRTELVRSAGADVQRIVSPTAQPASGLTNLTAWKPSFPRGSQVCPPSVEKSAPVGPTATNVGRVIFGTTATAER